MAQEIGDAVLRFLGDSTDLDVKLDGVRPKTEQAFSGAADAVEEGTGRMKVNLREARGEVGLLGEAFGVHLPRHVRTFVAELPGVGEAMSAAFSATAVLFVAQAVAQAAEKLSAFVANTLIFTEEMKKSNEEVANENKALVALADIYNKAKEKLDELNGATKSQEDAQRALAQATVDQAKAELAAMEVSIAHKSSWDKAKDTMKDFAGTIVSQVIPGYFRLDTATQEAIALEEKRGYVATVTAKALKATNEVNAEEAAKNAKLALDNSVRELENQKKVALAYAQTEQEKFELEQHFEEKKLALLNEYAVKDKHAIQALMTEIEVQQIQHADKVSAAFVNMLKLVQHTKEQALNELKTVDLATAIDFTPLEKAFLKAQDAAHSMGITLRTDLVANLDKATAAEKAFLQSGIMDAQALKAFEAEIKKANKALHDFDTGAKGFKLTEHGLFKQLKDDAGSGADAMQQWKEIGANALDSITTSAAQAFGNLLLAQGSFGEALKKATEDVLASIASQAVAQGIFDMAKAYEASAHYDYGASAQYTAAAETMFVVAALAGGGAAGLSHIGGGGSSGSGGSHAQSWNSQSDTGQSNRSGGNSVTVQAFAEGGLITAPTLALMGEAGREAVIPLDNPRAQQQLKDAGVSGGGGDTNIHLNVHGGLIAESTITQLCKHISKNVLNGKVQLHASNSLRVTKRSV